MIKAREQEFENYLLLDDNIVSKVKAVHTRMNKARMNEWHFDTLLDHIISDGKRMYEYLLKINVDINYIKENISSSLWKYNYFANGILFSTLSGFEN